MKKTMKVFGTHSERLASLLCVIALIAVMGFITMVTACSGGGGDSTPVLVPDPVPNELIGTWKTVDSDNYNNPDYATFTINTISIEINAPGEALVGTLTINVITVTPATNTDTGTNGTYPSGYLISGTISAATGNMGYLVGLTISTSIYLNSDKDRFILVVPSGVEVDNGGVWRKQ